MGGRRWRKTTDTMATPSPTAANEADISTWRVPVARHQTLDEARTSDDGTTVSRKEDMRATECIWD